MRKTEWGAATKDIKGALTIEDRVEQLEQKFVELEKKVESPEYAKRQFAALGGRAKSEAKARASRENGKKGWPLPAKGDS